MIFRLIFSLRGEVSPLVYLLLAPLLVLAQHGVTALAWHAAGAKLWLDVQFWLLPFRRLSELPALTDATALAAFAASLMVLWALAWLSFRRAARSEFGYVLAALTIVPGLQFIAVLLLIVSPLRQPGEEETPGEGANVAHVLQGLFAGVGLIVAAVMVSALTFGAYGWGLFVATPFLVGLTTAYIANRRTKLEFGRTIGLVFSAAALGSLALVALALEGIMCIILAAPLAAMAVVVGAALGLALASAGHSRGKPLLTVALLPAMFALEGAMPPAAAISTHVSIDIAAPPAAVWRALVSDSPVALPPGLVGTAGLAYPLRGRIVGEGIGAERIGYFSTGAARERITAWEPGRKLAFRVVDQPPAMEEMSPYRRVHAPHVEGYFDTDETSFELHPLGNGGTRLTARAGHILRIDPVPYWEPIARWAIAENTGRVLRDLKAKAERLSGSAAPR